MSKIFLIAILVVNLLPVVPVYGKEPGVLVVKTTDEAVIKQISGLGKAEELFDSIYRVETDDKSALLALLTGNPGVEFVHEDQKIQVTANPNDPLFVLDELELKKQWYEPKIELHQAWEKTTGNSQTIVAVVDTGIDGKHEDLNDGRVIGGYVDYCQTYKAGSSQECLIRIEGNLSAGANSDDNGHGTIIAGLIGAIANNGRGIAGVNWKVKLMPVKVLDSAGSGMATDVAKGIRWAADNGARVINLSIGGPGLEALPVLEEAITYAFNKNVLIIAAAGNDAAVNGGDLNKNIVYPVCAGGTENRVVGVAAVDYQDKKASFSNYGSNCIDISAPGTGTFIDKNNKQGLVSTYFDPTRPGEQDLYVYAVGTSVATPLVSGVAALMMDVFPDLDVRALRDRLIKNSDNIDDLNQTGCGGASCAGQIGFGRLNARKVLLSSQVISEGALVRATDSGLYYLVERGIKRLVSEFVYHQRFPNYQIISSNETEMGSYPLGPAITPSDGTIVKDPGRPLVYLVEGGVLRPLSYLAFASRGLRFSDIVTLSAAEISGYSLGSDADVLDGVLLKSASNPAVYILAQKERRLLSYYVFLQRGFESHTIAVVSEEDLLKYPMASDGHLYPPADGALVRSESSGTVYLVQQGTLHGLNYNAFTNRALKFSDVKIIADSELNGYEKGEPIVE